MYLFALKELFLK